MHGKQVSVWQTWQCSFVVKSRQRVRAQATKAMKSRQGKVKRQSKVEAGRSIRGVQENKRAEGQETSTGSKRAGAGRGWRQVRQTGEMEQGVDGDR